jgi:hypothetical protein
MMLAADYPLLDVVGTMLAFFFLATWTCILIIVVLVDVIDRQDLSGWAKAAWILAAIVLPILGLLAYIVSRRNELGERRARGAASAQAEPEALA